MPIFSLPSPCGIGTLGQAAREFVDFLEQAGQSCWQILPVGQTGFGDSPYQAVSSYAGNPYLIDLEQLAAEGLLAPEEYRGLDWGSPAQVDYALQYTTRYPLLFAACRRLLARREGEFYSFCQSNGYWLEDYALYLAIKEEQGGRCWLEWDAPLRLRQPQALEQARQRLGEQISLWKAMQYLFFSQWNRLREYANRKGISIIGDLPIYVSADSADVWANPQYFQLNEEGIPLAVAGCPPDGFSEDGQLWGNPLFDWERLKAEGYRWWIERIAFQFRIYDTLRIDHFRGFEAYYAIPYGAPNAREGQWHKGPDMEFFQAVEQALGKRSIIAEDLGFLTPQVRQMLGATGYPGMKVLEFAFDNKWEGSEYLPHCIGKNTVVYTGTHDNDTVLGWLASAPPATAAYAKEYLRLTAEEGYHWGMIRSAWATAADLAVIPLADLLGLGSEGRINTPSTMGNNWKWRVLPHSCTDALAQKIREDMAVYQRLPKPSP